MPPSQDRSNVRSENHLPSQIRCHTRSEIPIEMPRPREHRAALRRSPRRPSHLHNNGAANRRRIIRASPRTTSIRWARGSGSNALTNLSHPIHALTRGRSPGPKTREHPIRWQLTGRQSQDCRFRVRPRQTRLFQTSSANGSKSAKERLGFYESDDANAVFHAHLCGSWGASTGALHRQWVDGSVVVSKQLEWFEWFFGRFDRFWTGLWWIVWFVESRCYSLYDPLWCCAFYLLVIFVLLVLLVLIEI